MKWGKEIQEFIFEICHCQTPLDKNKVKPDKLLETSNSANEDIQFTM